MHQVRLRHQAHPQMATKSLSGSDTGWFNILGHVVGVREVRGSNPGGTFLLLCPNFAGNEKVLD